MAEKLLNPREVADVLVWFGHSRWKACEIAVDYSRGDGHARKWVNEIIRQLSERGTCPCAA